MQKARVLLSLLFTLATIHFIPNRPLVLAILVAGWWALFFPITVAEAVAAVLAAAFFLGQNYVCLRAGIFEFQFKDVLLMPYYEPALWAFYFLSMKRFITGPIAEPVTVGKKTVVGLVATSACFSLFSFDSHALFMATACSTTLLLVLFHEKPDVHYAVFALGMGFIVEMFGVSTGLWSYPMPDFAGIPLWFATMWISVGLLGRRFLFPAAQWIARRVGRSARIAAW
jgi:hypothetical protein